MANNTQTPLSKEYLEIWFSSSFNRQMADIQGEVSRLLNTNGKLEEIRNNKEYQGEPQVIRHVFEIIKMDPKNKERVPEIQKAENELFDFLDGKEGLVSEEKIREYWDGFLQAYIDEITEDEGT